MAAEAWTAERLRGSPVELFAEYLQEAGVVDPAMQALFAELLEEASA